MCEPMCKPIAGRIVAEGMGGFLCPPGHPAHEQSVETDLRRQPEKRGYMSLKAAVDCEWLDNATQNDARDLLTKWQMQDRLPIDAPDVQEWVLQVLGYFHNCYNLRDSSIAENWHVANLTIDIRINPLIHTDCHAGVHLIRSYYSEFVPTAEHFANAYWGQKPKKLF